MSATEGGLRQRSSASQPQPAAAPAAGWKGPLLSGFPTPPAPLDEGAAGAAEEDSDEGEYPDAPPLPHNPEDDLLLLTCCASFAGALLLAAALPLEGKLVSLLGMGVFMLGAAVLIFSTHARGALPLALGVGVACGSLGLLFGGILQEVLRYALLDLTGLRALLFK